MDGELWLRAHGLRIDERRGNRMRQYDEIRIVEKNGYGSLEIAEDLLGLLLCVGSMVFLLFLAGGL